MLKQNVGMRVTIERRLNLTPELELQQNVRALVLPLSEVTYRKDPYNIIEHDKKNLEAISDSIQEVGFGRSIVVDEDGVIIAGNGTYEVAQKQNATVMEVEVDDPNTLVVLKRKGLTERQKRRMALWDNRASDLHKYNKQAVARLTTDHPEQQLLAGVFSEREQEKMLRAHADAQMLAPGGTDDETPETSSVGVRAESGVRMISLFASAESQPRFVRKVRAFQSMFNTTTLTDTVFAIVERAYDEWLEKKDEDGEALLAENIATS